MTFQALLRTARAWFGMPVPAPEARKRVFPTGIVLPDKPAYDLLTRAFNFSSALIGVCLLSPLMLAIAAAVKLTSPGPALYRGARVGLGEAPFHIFKFRTMKVGSEQKIGKRLVQQDEDHYTPIGKFLRKYRLDELAQLFNVLRGDMNLVGPRPVRPIFLEDHKAKIPGYARRFTVRPGITGQAQVRGGYYTSPRHKLFYELLYIAHRSVLLDLKLVVLTFVRVMTRIFTTTLLFAWLLLMALVMPSTWRAEFEVGMGGLSVNLLYLVPTLIVFAMLIRRREGGRMYALKTPVDLPLLGFLLVTALIIPFSRFPNAAVRGLLWFICNGAVVFYLVLNSKLVTERRGVFVASLVGAVTLMSGLAIGEQLLASRAGQPFTRLGGTLGNPLLLSTVVVITLPLAVARVRQSEDVRRRLFYGLSAATLLCAAVLSLSRSGILAVSLALCIYFWKTHRRRALFAVVAAGLMLGSLALMGDDRMSIERATADLRAVTDRQAEALGLLTTRRMLVGAGARTMPNHLIISGRHRGQEADSTPAMENAYLTLFVDHGPLGLAFFLSVLFGGLGFMLRSEPELEDERAADDLRATASGVAGCAVLLFFSDALYSFPVMIVLWSALGLGIGTALTQKPGPRSVYRIVHFRHQL